MGKLYQTIKPTTADNVASSEAIITDVLPHFKLMATVLSTVPHLHKATFDVTFVSTWSI